MIAIKYRFDGFCLFCFHPTWFRYSTQGFETSWLQECILITGYPISPSCVEPSRRETPVCTLPSPTGPQSRPGHRIVNRVHRLLRIWEISSYATGSEYRQCGYARLSSRRYETGALGYDWGKSLVISTFLMSWIDSIIHTKQQYQTFRALVPALS